MNSAIRSAVHLHSTLLFACSIAFAVTPMSVSATGQHLKIITFDVPAAGKGSGQGTSTAGINLFGAIIGSYTDANNVSHSFLRQPDGEITTFDPPGTANVPYPQFNGSGAIGLNAEGAVAGYFVDKNLAVHAYLRRPNGKFTTYDWPGACTTSQNVGCHGSGLWDMNDFGVAVDPFLSSGWVATLFGKTPGAPRFFTLNDILLGTRT
jgi:hypothetical protein